MFNYATVLPFVRRPDQPIRSAVDVYRENREYLKKQKEKRHAQEERRKNNERVSGTFRLGPKPRFPLFPPPRPDGPGDGDKPRT